MLRSLFPRVHHKFLSMPLLGLITDGFDDWLASNGYTCRSRKCSIGRLPQIDAALRRRRVKEIANLTHSVLHDYWRALMKIHPTGAGTVRNLGRYLAENSLMADDRQTATSATFASILSEEYVNHLRQVRGFAASTVSHHRYTAQCFLQHLEEARTTLENIHVQHIESYVAKAGKCLSRASLQHDIGALRGFLRFLAMEGRIPPRLGVQIDTPRHYRLEQLPRALPWEMVRALLRSLDTTSAIGLRDYAMFLLIATYGLRSCEVVAITLDDIRWRQGSLRIHQRKTLSSLELPLTNEVSWAIVKHLKRTPPPAPHRRIFLRMRAPLGVLKPAALTDAFQSLVRKSGLSIPRPHGPHCLRHSFALHLLKNGTPLKTIGDILGHHTAESTAMYLRLATGDLREVALEVPDKRRRNAKEGQR